MTEQKTEEKKAVAKVAVPATTVAGGGAGSVEAVKTAVKTKKKKVVKQIPRGNAYVMATYNNTIITLTDPNGNVLAWGSAGMAGFKGPKKATPYAASMVAKTVVEKAADYGLKEVSVYVKGIGGGREGAIRALHLNGLNLVSINDVTPIPHNGCRPPRRRRV